MPPQTSISTFFILLLTIFFFQSFPSAFSYPHHHYQSRKLQQWPSQPCSTSLDCRMSKMDVCIGQQCTCRLSRIWNETTSSCEYFNCQSLGANMCHLLWPGSQCNAFFETKSICFCVSPLVQTSDERGCVEKKKREKRESFGLSGKKKTTEEKKDLGEIKYKEELAGQYLQHLDCRTTSFWAGVGYTLFLLFVAIFCWWAFTFACSWESFCHHRGTYLRI
ncbi:hypothetical protein TYRP_008749 [Tyrophagus putrescentiae]|nr:hypothetical protein TYRP_008749 [Tyrophagus putrescentiae]